MNDNLTIQQLLDDVLLQKVDRTSAEKSMTALGIQDPAMEIDVHFAAAKAIQRHNIIQQVQSVHQRYAQAPSTILKERKTATVRPMRPITFILRVAAAAVLIMGLFIGYEYTNTNSNQIYSSVYQSYEVNTSRSAVEKIPTHQMLEQFSKKDYAAVIYTYKSLTNTNNREKFLTAYAYHETKEYAAAIDLLQQILIHNQQSNTRLYNDEAEFYLGLSYLKINDIENSLLYFEPIIADPEHTFHNRFSRWTLIKLKWLK